jgi:hypothetical protein
VMWIRTAVPVMEPSFKDQDMACLATVELRGRDKIERLSYCRTDKPQANGVNPLAYFRGRSPAQGPKHAKNLEIPRMPVITEKSDLTRAGPDRHVVTRGAPSLKAPLVSRPEAVT